MKKITIDKFYNYVTQVNFFLKEDYNVTIEFKNLEKYLNNLLNINTMDKNLLQDMMKKNTFWLDYFYQINNLLNIYLSYYVNKLDIYAEIIEYLKHEKINSHILDLIIQENIKTGFINLSLEDALNKKDMLLDKISLLKILIKNIEAYSKFINNKSYELQYYYNKLDCNFFNSTYFL